MESINRGPILTGEPRRRIRRFDAFTGLTFENGAKRMEQSMDASTDPATDDDDDDHNENVEKKAN